MNIGRKEEFDVLSLDVTMPGFARMDWRRLRLTVQFAPGPYGRDQSYSGLKATLKRLAKEGLGFFNHLRQGPRCSKCGTALYYDAYSAQRGGPELCGNCANPRDVSLKKVCPECLESHDLSWFEPKSAVNIGIGLPVAIRLFQAYPGVCRYCIKQKLHDAELVVGVAKGEIREWPPVPGDQLELGG